MSIKEISEAVILSKTKERGPWPSQYAEDNAAYEATKENVHAFPFARLLKTDDPITRQRHLKEKAKDKIVVKMAEIHNLLSRYWPEGLEQLISECENELK